LWHLDPQIIKRIVRRHMSEVRACYENSGNADPPVEGRVSVPGGGVVSLTLPFLFSLFGSHRAFSKTAHLVLKR
jgi:hypothetical protein